MRIIAWRYATLRSDCGLHKPLIMYTPSKQRKTYIEYFSTRGSSKIKLPRDIARQVGPAQLAFQLFRSGSLVGGATSTGINVPVDFV
jgi:hypothetical protein